MTTTRSLILILLLFGTVINIANGAVLEVPLTRTEQIMVTANGTEIPTSSRTLTFTCNSNDRFLSGLIRETSGGSSYILVECKPPTYSYNAIAKGMIPRDPFVYNARSCTADLASDIPSNGTVPTTVAQGGGIQLGRRLLHTGDAAIARGVPTMALKPFRRFLESKYLSDAEKEELVQHIIQHPRSQKGVTQWLPNSANRRQGGRKLLDDSRWCYGGGVGGGIGAVVVAVAVYCPGMQTKEDVLEIAQAEAQTKFTEAMSIWADNATRLWTAQGEINTGLKDVQAKQLATSKLLAEFSGSINQTVHVLQNHTETFIAWTENQLQTLANNLTAGLVEAGEYADSRVAELQNVTLRNDQQIINAISVLNSQIAARDDVNTRRDVQEARHMMDLLMLVYHSSAGTDRAADRADKGLIGAIVDQMDAVGRVPMQDPAIPYVPPKTEAEQTVDELTVMVNRVRINYQTKIMVGVIEVPMIHQYVVTMYGNIISLSEQLPDSMSHENLLSAFGPLNCTTLATENEIDTVRACRAWLTIEHQSCPMKPTFDGWQTITTTTSREPYILTSAYCDGVNPDPDIYDGVVLDSILDISNFAGDIACNSGADLAGDGKFQVVSDRMGVSIVPTVYESYVCDMDFVQLFILGIGDPLSGNYIVSLPYALFTSYSMAWPLIRTERTRSEALTYGIRPRGVTSVKRPFVTVNGNGRTASCVDTSIVGMGPDTNIIYTLQRLPMEREITTQVWSGEPDCTTIPGVCTPTGDLISTTSVTAAVDVSTTDSGEPFQNNDIIVGELVSLADGGMSYVTDLASGTASVSPEPAARENTVSYILWNLPDGYVLANEALNPPIGNLPDWESVYPGIVFDHTKTLSSGYHEAPVNVGTGRCIPVPGIEFQQVCNVLEGWSVGSNTDMRAGGLVLSAKNWQMEVTLNVAFDGTLAVFVSEGCPQVTFVGDPLIGRYIQLYNPSARQLNVLIERAFADGNDEDDCATLGNFANDDTGIGPFQTVQVLVPPNCGNITVQISQYNQASGKTIACGGPVNTWVSVATQSNVIGEGIANMTTVLVSNTVIESISASTLTQIQFQMQLMYETVKLADPTSNITLEQIQANAFANSSFAAFIAQLELQANGIIFSDPTFEQQWAVLVNLTNNQGAALNQSLNEQAVMITDLQGEIAQQNAQILAFQQQTIELKATLEEWKQANDNLIAGLQDNACDFTCTITNIGYGIAILIGVILLGILGFKLIMSYAQSSSSIPGGGGGTRGRIARAMYNRCRSDDNNSNKKRKKRQTLTNLPRVEEGDNDDNDSDDDNSD